MTEPRARCSTAEVKPFAGLLERQGLDLARAETSTLQVNVGYLCNQACRHCHLEAGPGRREIMTRETMEEVAAYAERCAFEVVDVTGGAAELVPDLPFLLEAVAPHCRRLMLRSNLTALSGERRESLLDLCRRLKVVIVASVPSTSAGQVDAQRGAGVWERSLDTLRALNEAGFGRPGSGLELDLVVNPAGPYLPADQCQVEKKFKVDLERRWGLGFNSLYTFANVPLGRFARRLREKGQYDAYLGTLAERFNGATLAGLMCRSLVSVSWEGILHDCDFNLAAGIPLGGERRHLRDETGPPPAGTPIAVGDHCYACTAGSGFT